MCPLKSTKTWSLTTHLTLQIMRSSMRLAHSPRAMGSGENPTCSESNNRMFLKRDTYASSRFWGRYSAKAQRILLPIEGAVLHYEKSLIAHTHLGDLCLMSAFFECLLISVRRFVSDVIKTFRRCL